MPLFRGIKVRGLAMNAKAMTGWFLILGPILSMLFWMTSPVGLLGETAGEGTAQESIAALAGNADWAEYSAVLILLGMVIWLVGWSGVKSSMSGGSAVHWAGAGLWSLAIAVAVWAVGSGALAAIPETMALSAEAAAGAAAAAAAGQEAAAAAAAAGATAAAGTAGTLWAVSEGLDGIGSIFAPLAMLLFSYAFLQQKNYSQAIAGAGIIIGAINVVFGVLGSDVVNTSVQGIGFMLISVWSIWIGVTVLRSKA